MKLIDSNVWLALALADHEHHKTANQWLSSQTEIDSLAFCRLTQLTFLRLLTTKVVLNFYGVPPLNNDQALDVYKGFLLDARICFINEPSQIQEYWFGLTSDSTSSPKLWMDANLAAFAIAGGYELVTLDRAFIQFAGLNLVVL